MEFFVSVIYIAAIIAASASVLVLLLKGKSMPCNTWYIGCQAMVVFWCISQIWILLSHGIESLWGAYLAGNIGVCFIGAFWLVFALEYTERKGRNVFLLKTGAFLLSSVHYVLMLSNGWHHLYYPVFSEKVITHGVFFYSNVAFTYVFVLFGAVLMYRSFPKKTRGSVGRNYIIAAVLFPVILNGVYISGFLPVSYDITPMGFALSGVFVLLATIKYRFMEINVAAFDKVVSDLEDGVAIFEGHGETVFCNPAFCRLLELTQEKTLAEIWERLKTGKIEEDGMVSLGRDRHLQIQVYRGDGSNFTALETPFAWDTEERGYSVDRIQERGTIFGSGNGQVYVLVVKDMQYYYALLERTRWLAVADQKLMLERERGRIAGEVHDTAGHTLTMIQSYMKLAMVDLEKREYGSVREYLGQARELSLAGIKELRESINQMKREQESELVTQTVLRLADQVKEVPVEVTVQGEEDDRYLSLSQTVHDCVRESITNMLKYAAASEMEIVLRFQKEKLELVMADDGVGCEEIVDSQGLAGIRERVEERKGTVRFSSGPGQGFLTVIQFPVEVNV